MRGDRAIATPVSESPHGVTGLDGPGSRLEALHLQKSYGSRMVVKDVSLAVGKGEVTVRI